MKELNKEEVINIVNAQLLNSLDGMNSTIGLMLAALTAIIAVISFASVMSYFSKKKIIEEAEKKIEQAEKKITLHINKLFREETTEIQNEIQEKLTKYVKNNTKQLQKRSQHEEYLRNIIFYDLNKALATELNNGNNISDVFTTFAERFHIIAQLTSGNNEQATKALKKLAIDSSRKIIRFNSIKNYISYLKEQSDDYELLGYIDKFETSQIVNRGT